MSDDMERLRDEALLGDTSERNEPGTAAERIAPFDDHAAYDETAAEVGNDRNILVGDDPGLAGADTGSGRPGSIEGRRPYVEDRDEIAPS